MRVSAFLEASNRKAEYCGGLPDEHQLTAIQDITKLEAKAVVVFFYVVKNGI